MTQHTAGEWVIRDGDEWTHDVVTLDGVNTEGEQLYWNVASANGRRREVKANLRLIAAAPKMLEALRLLQAEMILSGNAGSEDFGWKPAIQKARAAIAAATGEQA